LNSPEGVSTSTLPICTAAFRTPVFPAEPDVVVLLAGLAVHPVDVPRDHRVDLPADDRVEQLVTAESVLAPGMC
jgi:hypothetical protein